MTCLNLSKPCGFAAGVVLTVAGSGVIGSNDGVGSAARFNLPAGIAVTTSGNILVADTWSYSIRMITTAGMIFPLCSGFMIVQFHSRLIWCSGRDNFGW